MRAVAMLLAGSLVALAGCSNPATLPPTAQGTLADSADQVLYGVRHWLHSKGTRQAHLLSDTAYVFDDNMRFELADVTAFFFDTTGVQTATLTARSGTYLRNTLSMEARGSVVVTTPDGKQLNTEHLRYDPEANLLASDTAFTMLEPGRRAEGKAFTSDPGLRTVRCTECTYTGPGPPTSGRGGTPPPAP